PQGIFALQGSDRLDRVGAAECRGTSFRQAEVPDLPLLYQVLHGSGNFFDGNVGINAMLIQQVDDIGFKPPERGVSGLPDVLGPAVQANLFTSGGIDFE